MTCGRRPIQEIRIEKARGRFPAQAFEFLRWWEYAGDLPDVSNVFPTPALHAAQAASNQIPEPVAARLSWWEPAKS
jgi:hypothetical protein